MIQGESILEYIASRDSEEEDLFPKMISRERNGLERQRQTNDIYDFGNEMYDRHDYYGNSWVMKAIVNELSNKYTFISLEGQLYIYDISRGFFRLLPMNSCNRQLRALLSKEMIGILAKKDLSELYEWLVSKADPVKEHELNKYDNYINFADCACNYKTHKTQKDREKMHFRYALAISYSESKKRKSTGEFQKFIKKIFKNDDDTIREFRKFFGLALSNIRCLKLAFIFYGSSNSGKTTMLNLLNLIFDPECSTYLTFSQLTNDSTVSEMIGKHICLTSSIAGMNGRSSKRMDMFKSLVGNDYLSVKQSGGVYSKFRNRSLFVFACDYLPEINNIYEVASFMSRIIIFPFKKVFKREDWKMYACEKIFRDTAGIVKFAMKGLKDLEDSNFEFHESEAMRIAKEEFQGNLESFTIFAERYVKRSKNGKLSTQEINTAYAQFCDLREVSCLKLNQWTIDDISKELGVGKMTVYKLVKENVKHTRIGRRILVDEKDLSDYLSRSTEQDSVHIQKNT